MKKYVGILNLVLLLSIVSSIVFPAAHAFEHIAHAYSEEKCLHTTVAGETQITHQHSHLDHCYLCEFSLGNFVAPDIFDFPYFSSYRNIPYVAYVVAAPQSFSGSSYYLRGPPVA